MAIIKQAKNLLIRLRKDYITQTSKLNEESDKLEIKAPGKIILSNKKVVTDGNS